MIFKIAGLALLSAILAFLLRGFGYKGVPVFLLAVFVGMLSLSFPYLERVRALVDSIGSLAGVSDAVGSVMKAVGIGYLSGITADVCRELEANSVATAVVLVGRIEIIAVAAPYFMKLVDLGGELIG